MKTLATILVASLTAVALLCCGGPITIRDTSAPGAYTDASDPCAAGCGYITAAKCTTAGQFDNPRCAPNCREDQAQTPQGRMFPLACILDAGADAASLAACGVTCP